MVDNRAAVSCEADVDLDAVGTLLEGALDSGKGVLRMGRVCGSAMSK